LRTGRWQPGPGREFFEAVRAALPEARIIAEDLGYIGPDVVKLRREVRRLQMERDILAKATSWLANKDEKMSTPSSS
jgi:4-alpha-glucanotransferase